MPQGADVRFSEGVLISQKGHMEAHMPFRLCIFGVSYSIQTEEHLALPWVDHPHRPDCLLPAGYWSSILVLFPLIKTRFPIPCYLSSFLPSFSFSTSSSPLSSSSYSSFSFFFWWKYSCPNIIWKALVPFHWRTCMAPLPNMADHKRRGVILGSQFCPQSSATCPSF